MTKRDWKRISESVAATRRRISYGQINAESAVEQITRDLCAVLKAENAEFNPALFLAACGYIPVAA